MAYKSNEKQVYGTRVRKSGDPAAIKAYASGDFVGLGIDVTALDVVFEDWKSFGKQVVAAAADVGTGYVLYRGGKDIIGGNSDSHRDNNVTVTTGEGNSTIVNINGDYNTVNLQQRSKK